MRQCFVTGAGTEIGKTFVTCGMITACRRQGRTVAALKPVASGYVAAEAAASDPGRLLAALGRPLTAAAICRIAPWRFRAPLSPDQAAEAEGRNIDFAALVDFCRAAGAGADMLLIEGIGGVMVPLDDRHTVADWITALASPVALVCGSYLGAISHGLSALELLRRRGVTILAVIVNESAGSTVPLARTAETITRFAGGVPVLTLPWLRDAEDHPVFAQLAHLAWAGTLPRPGDPC